MLCRVSSGVSELGPWLLLDRDVFLQFADRFEEHNQCAILGPLRMCDICFGEAAEKFGSTWLRYKRDKRLADAVLRDRILRTVPRTIRSNQSWVAVLANYVKREGDGLPHLRPAWSLYDNKFWLDREIYDVLKSEETFRYLWDAEVVN